jgi:hypothetical protein
MSSIKLQDIMNLVTFSKNFCSRFYSFILTHLGCNEISLYTIEVYLYVPRTISEPKAADVCVSHCLCDRFCVFVYATWFVQMPGILKILNPVKYCC